MEGRGGASSCIFVEFLPLWKVGVTLLTDVPHREHTAWGVQRSALGRLLPQLTGGLSSQELLRLCHWAFVIRDPSCDFNMMFRAGSGVELGLHKPHVQSPCTSVCSLPLFLDPQVVHICTGPQCGSQGSRLYFSLSLSCSSRCKKKKRGGIQFVSYLNKRLCQGI